MRRYAEIAAILVFLIVIFSCHPTIVSLVGWGLVACCAYVFVLHPLAEQKKKELKRPAKNQYYSRDENTE